MFQLKVFKVIESKDRNSCIDFFRGLAIISVVLYHYNGSLSYGYLGVDLFFVVSGLLVSNLLINDLFNENEISFFRFFLQRAFKIWPSYYGFILFGSLIAFYLYNQTNPEQLISTWDLARYLFFYHNYTGLPFHWSFDHIWSLCVEEHFYILLPILFLIIQRFIKKEHNIKMLLVFTVLIISSGILFKLLSYYCTNSQDTYSATHNRIDALAWGVLLCLLTKFYSEKIKKKLFSLAVSLIGIMLFTLTILISIYYKGELFNKLFLHDLIPISFFLLILGTFYLDFSRFRLLRYIAYYSYNWYLWHPVFVIFITKHFGDGSIGLLFYLFITFFISVIATVLIEEPFLKIRNSLLSKLYN